MFVSLNNLVRFSIYFFFLYSGLSVWNAKFARLHIYSGTTYTFFIFKTRYLEHKVCRTTFMGGPT